MSVEYIICPSCKGERGGMAFLCGPGTHQRRWMACSTCKGDAVVTPEHAARIEYGRLMRQDRIRRHVSQREEAARLGCDVGEWSRIEHGDEPETEEGRRALEVRRGERLQAPPEDVPDYHPYQQAPDWPGSLCTRCGKTKTADVHAPQPTGA